MIDSGLNHGWSGDHGRRVKCQNDLEETVGDLKSLRAVQ